VAADRYDNGVTPSIAVSGTVAVEVHKSQNNDRLWYHVGTIDAATKKIDWGPSDDYDNGVTPAVAVVGTTAVEVHKSQNNDTLWYRVGTIQAATKKINWS
jgi:hypothetical protein